ncbi:MAG: hypothetical protein ACRC34_02755 [Cetobacterium sp.]
MKKILYFYFFISIIVSGESIPMIPMIPILPSIPLDRVEESENGEIKTRTLLETGSLSVVLKAEVVLPLEVITDVDIKALIVDDENLEIPFEVELNRAPESAGIYKLHFSSTSLDIDDDGVIDTEILANKNLNSKIIKDNYVKITGKNISKEGTHKKRVYITVEVNN